jgi:hypothetical protein
VNSFGALWKIPSVIPFVIDMMNSVHSLPTALPMEFIPSVIPLVKMTRHHFFFFNFFSHGNSLGIYRGNISVGKIPRKVTDGNIPSIFLFVFINFLVVYIFQYNEQLLVCVIYISLN